MDVNALLPPVLAFLIGGLLSWLGFWFSGRWGFLCRSASAWAYIALQGVVGAAGYLLLSELTENGVVALPEAWKSNCYAQAVFMGFLAKSLSYVTLFDAGGTDQKKSVGFKFFVDGLQEKVAEDEKIAVIEFLIEKEKQYGSVDSVKETIRRWIPHELKDKKTLDTFLGDLENQNTVYDAMLQFLREVGKKMFESAFPDRK